MSGVVSATDYFTELALGRAGFLRLVRSRAIETHSAQPERPGRAKLFESTRANVELSLGWATRRAGTGHYVCEPAAVLDRLGYCD